MFQNSECIVTTQKSQGTERGKEYQFLELVQVTRVKVEKEALDFLEKMRAGRSNCQHVEATKLQRSNEGITFNQGHTEDLLQHKIFNKGNIDKQLIRNFEKESEKKLNEEKMKKKENNNSRIKIPNIVIFESGAKQMVSEWEQLVNETVEMTRSALKIDRINYNYNRTFRHDRMTQEPLDYALIFFDEDVIAAKFIELIDGFEFYGSFIRPVILPPRRK